MVSGKGMLSVKIIDSKTQIFQLSLFLKGKAADTKETVTRPLKSQTIQVLCKSSEILHQYPQSSGSPKTTPSRLISISSIRRMVARCRPIESAVHISAKEIEVFNKWQ